MGRSGLIAGWWAALGRSPTGSLTALTLEYAADAWDAPTGADFEPTRGFGLVEFVVLILVGFAEERPGDFLHLGASDPLVAAGGLREEGFRESHGGGGSTGTGRGKVFGEEVGERLFLDAALLLRVEGGEEAINGGHRFRLRDLLVLVRVGLGNDDPGDRGGGAGARPAHAEEVRGRRDVPFLLAVELREDGGCAPGDKRLQVGAVEHHLEGERAEGVGLLQGQRLPFEGDRLGNFFHHPIQDR